MYLNIFILLFFNIMYTFIVCDSKCSEYILVIQEKICNTTPVRIFMRPAGVETINWDSCDQPHGSTDVLTQSELYSNKTCLLELNYQRSDTTCPSTITTVGSREFYYTEKNIETTTFPSLCKIEDDKDSCSENMLNQPDNIKIDRTRNAISIVYVNVTTKNSLELNNTYNISKDLTLVMECTYNENICINENNITENEFDGDIKSSFYKNSHSPTEDTIIVSLKENDFTTTELTYETYHQLRTQNNVGFNCSTPLDGIQVEQEPYITLSYDILRKYNCRSNYSSGIHYKTSALTTRNVNVYYHKNFMLDNTEIKNTKCMDDFESVNNHTLTLDCNIIASNLENNKTSTIVHDLANINIYGINLNKTLIWHCQFGNIHENYSFASDTSKLQQDNAVIMDFHNCAEDYKNINKSVEYDNRDIIMVLRKDGSNKTYSSTLFSNNNLNLHLDLNNENDCNIMRMNITNGKLINWWTADKQAMIRKHYNTTVVELKILNCVTNIIKDSQSKEYINKPLDLNIIFNNANNTALYTSILNDLNKIKSESTNLAILDCVHNSEETNTDLTLKEKLILECTFTDLDAVSNNIGDPTKTLSEITPIELTTTEKSEDKFTTAQTVKNIQAVTTESNRQTYTSGLEGSPTGNKEDTYLDPIVYILITLVSIVVVSALIAFVLRKFRAPVSYHVTSTRDWPVTEDEVQEAL